MKIPTHIPAHIVNQSDNGINSWKGVLETIGASFENIEGRYLLFLLQNYFKDLLPLTVIAENNYTDRDFRSLYYRHYAKVYRSVERQSVRLHIFRDLISFKNICPPANDLVSLPYEGYLCLSLLDRPYLGRTVLRFYPNDKRDFICQTEHEARLFGCKLSVKGFPFIWQDQEVIRCAHVSLWMIHRYFSTRYNFYREALPHEILWDTEVPWKRLIPSGGLNVMQLGSILSALGYHPEVLSRSEDPEDFFSVLHAYIESRIPVIACTRNHAVVIIGRSAPKADHLTNSHRLYRKEGAYLTPYYDAADYCDSLIVNDDRNLFPYKYWNRKVNSLIQGTSTRTIKDVEFIIVPLYEKIFLSARLAKSHGLSLISHPKIGIRSLITKKIGKKILENINLKDPLIIRTVLTSSRTYLNYLTRTLSDESTAQLLRYFNLPKFIWLVEISTKDLFFKNVSIPGIKNEQSGMKFGEILLDATAGRDFHTSWLFIRYPGVILCNQVHTGPDFPHTIEVDDKGESFPEPMLVNSF
ncbi:hypothetical protein CEE37_15045 [candidate division LCP-89 bacterium B3_LCP]|uniref:Uncharacterized protein n=1 Tax=candidate division LCP-89 bacterium B3_LCP TaxID=2012998 RepID=A0A532UNS8_UNCL8|nr:MAG: hypothetical protein CEE37_15045 [candidate division LCP-89 bacterium B3_LCP]